MVLKQSLLKLLARQRQALRLRYLQCLIVEQMQRARYKAASLYVGL